MKVTYSWIIYSCLIFGTGILCERKLERRQAVSSISENIDDKFNCSNGQFIEWSLLCDGHGDCSDGSDEIKELCALYEFETNMAMDCGRVHNMKNQVTPEETDKSIIELAPWAVAVYEENKNYKGEKIFLFIEPASIIAPNIAISCGKYLFQMAEDHILRKQYKIGPIVKGILFEDYELLIDVTMIYRTTKDIAIAGNNTQTNMVVIVLANKLLLSNGFAPICIDWFSKYDLRKETQMRIIGNFTRLFIGNTVIQYFTHDRTANDETSRIEINTDTHIINVYQGSGLGILNSKTNQYFLTAILSNLSLRNNGSEVETMDFINIKNYIPWIRGILNKHITVNSCVLPTVEGVIYSHKDSNEILSPGTLIDRHVNVIENCEVGYHKASLYGFRVCQGKGKWLLSSDKLCFNKCPPLESDSLDIKCTHNGKYANCSNPSIPDTIAKPLCKPLYTAPNGYENEPLELRCQSNGTWNKELYRCNPNCGKTYTINDGIVMGGKPARSAGTAPWNVGVYRFETISNDYNLICGGSIISPNLVVSAAHCFYKEGMLSNRISFNDVQTAEYKIAVGKYSRNITIIDNEFTKIMNVKTVYLNEYYYGYSGFHADDIAIVVLRNRISFSIGVSPICVDWTGRNTIPNGAEGKIAGWGKTEKGIASPILLEASLPYINHRSCRNMYDNGFESYVTKDKFCAGSALGQGVNGGDSGAGLSFLHSNNLYYLTGVASVKDPNTNSSIEVFTDVKHHIEFISRLYNIS